MVDNVIKITDANEANRVNAANEADVDRCQQGECQ